MIWISLLLPNIYIRIRILKEDSFTLQIKIHSCFKHFFLALDRRFYVINELDIPVIVKILGFVLQMFNLYSENAV